MGIYGVQVKSPSGKTKTIRIDAKSKRIAPVPLKKYFGKKFLTYKKEEARFFWIYYSFVQDRPKLTLDAIEVADAR